MRFGELFAGIGGIGLGLERAGMEVVWQVEKDPYCLRVLEKHWPELGRIKMIPSLTPRQIAENDEVKNAVIVVEGIHLRLW